MKRSLGFTGIILVSSFTHFVQADFILDPPNVRYSQTLTINTWRYFNR